MTIVAADEVAAYVREHGGRLYVWATDHRCCGGRLTLLDAGTAPPARPPGDFVRYDAGGYDVFLAAGVRRPPHELALELKGRRQSVRAFWNGCAFVA